MKQQPGFSLVEILIAVSIIALLSVVTISGFTKVQARSRDAKRVTDVGILGVAIETYRSLHGVYPPQKTPGRGFELARDSLGVLVSEGLINNLPTEPKPVNGLNMGSNQLDANGNIIPGSPWGWNFCLDYTYQTPYVWGFERGYGNTSYDYVTNQVITRGSPLPGYNYGPDNRKIGDRQWAIHFRQETVGALNTNTFDAANPTFAGGWCERSPNGNMGVIFGPVL